MMKETFGPSKLFEDIISDSGSISIICEMCGRTHFGTASPNLFEEGELEELRKKAKKNPGLYLEDSDNDCIGWGIIDGKQVVIGCPCKSLRKYEAFIWTNRHIIMDYLTQRLEEEFTEKRSEFESAQRSAKALKESEGVAHEDK